MSRRGWDASPVALLTLRPDGAVVDANDTFLAWVGRSRDEVVGQVRLPDLLSVGGRIYWETHLSPLLHVERRLDEVALELSTPAGRRPVLLTAVADDGSPLVHAALSSASERARYEQELLAARRSADRSAGRLRALQQVTAALSSALGVDGVAHALVTAAVGPLGATAATLWVADGDARLVRHSGAGEPAAEPPLPPGAALHASTAVAHAGRTVVPLHGVAALQGALSLLASDDPAAEPLDLEVLTAVGQQAGLALDRAQLYEQSASVARELQHSLLATEPPADARYDVATAYRPGVERLEVGGDWYDVFLAGDGVLAVVVGDVVGRGLGAAIAMGQLRSAVRAVAGPGVGPAALLSRLDRFVESVEAAGMATLAYAELDLASGAVRYACAGHPPPVLLAAGGDPDLLWDGRSTPLGAFLTPQQRSEAEVQLSAGDRLLLYTDGLVERRDRALDDGLTALQRTAGPLSGRPLEEVVATLTTTMLEDEDSRDDVCVLLLEWSPPFDRVLAADLTTLADTRHGLARWLDGHGADPAVRDDVVLATSEAVANAAEHGSGGRPAEHVHVHATLEGAVVRVVVRDHGRWRERTPSDERGRGMLIMRRLLDVDVEQDDGTRVVLRAPLRSAR